MDLGTKTGERMGGVAGGTHRFRSPLESVQPDSGRAAEEAQTTWSEAGSTLRWPHVLLLRAQNVCESQLAKYVCAKCHTKIPIVDLEAIFHDELKAFFAAPESIAKHLTEANANVAEKENLLKAHRTEIQKIRDEMARTHRLYLDGQITAQGFGQFYKPAEERLNQLLAELPKLEAELDHLKVNTLSAEEVVSEAEALYARWPKLPAGNKRRIVESIVEKITIGKDEIDLTLSYLPSSEEMIKNQQALPRP